MRKKVLQDRRVKKRVLEEEIKRMLKARNPFEGIYGMYGDHPNFVDIRNGLNSLSRKK